MLHAGLVSAPFVTVDDTGARHANRNFQTTQIGGEHFTAFRTPPSKSRLNFLALLHGNYQDYVLNEPAPNLSLMRSHLNQGVRLQTIADHLSIFRTSLQPLSR